MSEVRNYDNIVVLEVGISSFSGGGFKVKYDFKRNLISWSDGYMWNNNFLKAINSDKRSLIEDRLPNTNMLEWMCAYNEGQCDMVGRKTANPFCWKIEVLFDDDKKYEAVGKQHFPMKWDSLRYLIEDTTECTFRLR